MSEALEIAVLGDLHGDFELERDAPLLDAYPLSLCTGDLTPNRGRLRFDEALRLASELGRAGVWTLLGNHDGPTCFTGRRFPRSYRRLEKALAGHHLGGRRVELPALGLSLVGGRPLTVGGPELRFPVPEREDWDLEAWGRHLGDELAAAEHELVLVLAHCGPTGLGASRDAPYGRDFGGRDGDWGDPDLRVALERAAQAGRPPAAVIAGHMHHRLNGGGRRARCRREGPTLHVNAAVVPRVRDGLRALTVVRIEDGRASARLDWHGPEGVVASEALESDDAAQPPSPPPVLSDPEPGGPSCSGSGS